MNFLKASLKGIWRFGSSGRRSLMAQLADPARRWGWRSLRSRPQCGRAGARYRLRPHSYVPFLQRLRCRAAPWELAPSPLFAEQERLPPIAPPIATGRLTDARSWMIAEPRVLSTLGAAELSRQRLLRAIR